MRNYEGVGGTGGAGRLMKILLGIDANNVSAPDSVEYEIKTSMQASNLITLFHKEPGERRDGAMAALVKRILLETNQGELLSGYIEFSPHHQ